MEELIAMIREKIMLAFLEENNDNDDFTMYNVEDEIRYSEGD